MGIIERLDACYVDATQLVGKTIAAAVELGQGDAVLRFTDGKWYHTLPQGFQTLGVLEEAGTYMRGAHPLVDAGLAADAEVAEYWDARSRKQAEMNEQRELEVYAKLKAKFERTA